MKRLFQALIVIAVIMTAVTYFYSCKKDKNKIEINGRVYDPNSGTYLANATVTISSSRISSGFYNSNYSDITSAVTDANGNFTLEFEREKSSGYRFFIRKDKYFDVITDVPDADIVPGTIYTPTFELLPEGFIRLHVKNNQPWNSADFVAFSYNSGNISCYQCCNSVINKGYGMTFDTTTFCKTSGNHNVIINWHYTKMGTDVAFSDTIFCPQFDTAYYEILY